MYRKCFDVIEYAVYYRSYETENYVAFEEKMRHFTNKCQ